MRIKWLVLTGVILASITLIWVFVMCGSSKPFLDENQIVKLEIFYPAFWVDDDQTPLHIYTDKEQITPWIDFFNSLNLTNESIRCSYNRPPTGFKFYYADGKIDTISYCICHMTYNGREYYVNDNSNKADLHDKLIGFR